MSHGAGYQLLAEHQSSDGPSVVQIRGSLIVSSLQTLRDLELYERYLACLPQPMHDQVLYVLAASWVPVDIALAHYAACDAMQLSEAELESIGQHVSRRIMGTFLATLMRSARLVVTPTSVPLRQYPRLWDRLMLGGSCRVGMLGPKEGRIESMGVPMFRYRYFRIAYVGLIRGAGLMFRSSVHARIRSATENSLTIDVSWT
jgi:hypothetical protein